jgi:hypothetical protein
MIDEGLPDPFADIDYSQSHEQSSLDEMEALRTQFLRRSRTDLDRFAAVTDSEYWFCLCFASREQKELFLRAMQWLEFGDKYLDGQRVAARQGIPLPEARIPFVTEKPDPALSELSLPLPE